MRTRRKLYAYKRRAPAPHTLPVGKDKQLFLIFPATVSYVDYGSTNVEVEKAEGVDNILAVKAMQAYTEDTNISVVVEGGDFIHSTCITSLLRSVSVSLLTGRIHRKWPYLMRRSVQANRKKGSGKQSVNGYPWIWNSKTRMPAWSSRLEISLSTRTYCCCA